MKLDVMERMTLVPLLPDKGDFSALKTIRRAKEMLSFSPEEIKLYEITTTVDENGISKTSWNGNKASKNIKDCPVDEYTKNVIAAKLSEMNREGELTEQHLSLYEKFVIAYQ